MKSTPCVISAAEHAGWANVVCVAAPGGAPAVVDRRRVTLIGEGLPTMPYHLESIGMRENEANALIARVRRSIAASTARGLRGIVTDLAPEFAAAALAIRKSPFSELPETVAAVWQSYRLQCAADGMLYQLALCRAARDLGLEVHLCGRGEEIAGAAARLEVRPDEIESFVSRTGRPRVRPGRGSTGAHTPPASQRWRRVPAVASGFDLDLSPSNADGSPGRAADPPRRGGGAALPPTDPPAPPSS
jgi:hypothetical protein